MKTLKKVLALSLVLCLVFALVSCGKTLSGTYSAGGDIGGLVGGGSSYTFSGSKVTVTVSTTILGSTKTVEYEGTYEITEAADGSMTISMTFEDADAKSYSVNNQKFVENKDAGTITIGLVTYTKQK